jgi:hypothetical protein
MFSHKQSQSQSQNHTATIANPKGLSTSSLSMEMKNTPSTEMQNTKMLNTFKLPATTTMMDLLVLESTSLRYVRTNKLPATATMIKEWSSFEFEVVILDTTKRTRDHILGSWFFDSLEKAERFANNLKATQP